MAKKSTKRPVSAPKTAPKPKIVSKKPVRANNGKAGKSAPATANVSRAIGIVIKPNFKPAPPPKAVKRSEKDIAKKNHAPPVILAAPVPTDGKPRKNQAGLNSRDLEMYRSLLLAKRRELVGDMSSMEHEALRSTSGTNLSNLPIHMADMGTDNYEQEFTLGLVEKDRQLLREINSALAKIQDGTYGLCEGTGKPISKARLEAQPWAKYSIEYARQLEKGGIRR